MHNQRLLLLLLLVTYIYLPTLLGWMTNPEGGWYRPFIIWVMLIAAAFIVQKRNRSNGI
ncbi:hypothetical protein G8764_07110 [Pseudomaricurvus alcaniphilus]|uniref:hypothetical protein n=1 Tax=Pseudomaricurvus alcaniphilus TaxID=1166482 RepID=UPI00140A22D7|nr:hypothetical protein [Pseudomaricurvus alcaniphilus]NHN37055.1 hypothetical protein [Pseudomaricurvus alcaniphilus]